MDEPVVVHPATPERWPDLVELFERRGPRGGTPVTANCWCMWWRERSGDASTNRSAMRSLVEAGAEPGLIAYAGGIAVGWVSIGPREQFGQLLRSPQYRPRDDDPGVHSLVCFYVDPRWKGSGVAGALLDAAIDWARQRGATVIEAYANAQPDYMGRLESFERRGFSRVRGAGKRAVVRLTLASPPRGRP